VVSIGTIHAGTANNIIPDCVELTGTVRNLSAQRRERMPAMISRIVEDTCRAYRCSGKVRYIEQVPPVLNDDTLTSFTAEVLDGLLGRHNRSEPAPMTYGEDFAEYLRFAKGCFFWLGSGPQADADQAASGRRSFAIRKI
ncbi:MAG: amidohydrolase, partial [Paenibacillus sp.]|nr:amidohydrolase [Paenibacillus sp.]